MSRSLHEFLRLHFFAYPNKQKITNQFSSEIWNKKFFGTF